MKHLKTLGLAVLAAMALAAFLGAGSASATVLCKTATNPCPVGSKYMVGTKLDMSLTGTGVWEDTFLGTKFQECTSSTIEGTSWNSGGALETVIVQLEKVWWGNPESTCSKTTDLLRWGAFEIHSIAGTHDGTLTGIATEWTIGGTNCVYGFAGGTHLGTIKGGNPATVEINGIVPPLSGSCTAKYRWTATYTIGTPKPLYVEPS